MEVWWPHYATVVTRRIGTVDRRLHVLRGLFSGYLLAGVDEPSDTTAIKSTKGVASVVVGPAGVLFVLPKQIAEWQAKALNADGLFEPPDWAQLGAAAVYKPGERVKIASGNPFVGFMAQVRRVTGSAVVAELEEQIFGRRITLDVDASQLERPAKEGRLDARKS